MVSDQNFLLSGKSGRACVDGSLVPNSLFLAGRGKIPLLKLGAVVAGDGAVGRVRTEAAGLFFLQ